MAEQKKENDLVPGTTVKKEKFQNVIFTDKSTIQLEQHSRLCFRKRLLIIHIEYIHSIKYTLILFFCMIVSKTWCYTQWHITFYTHIFSVSSLLFTVLRVFTYITSPPSASSS